MLSFIGIGDAFSPNYGNCSAFYKNDKFLLLIDCGENIFEKIIKLNLLNNVNKVYIIITHFHTDHIGSLGSLLFYLDKIGISDTTIVYPNLNRLNVLLDIFGVTKCNYKTVTPNEVNDFKIKCYNQEHSFMESFGYLFYIENNSIYFSGDTKCIRDEIVKKLLNKDIDFFYQDVRLDSNSYHISLEELNKIIPFECRNLVNCMHLNEFNDNSILISNGYKIVKKYRGV